MVGRVEAFVVLLAAVLGQGSESGMINSGPRLQDPLGRCRVVGEEKLSSASPNSAAICAEVERTITSEAPGAAYSVEIKVISPSRLATTLVVNGRTLPVQNFAVMDGRLGTGSVTHFAKALAGAVADAARH